MDSRDLGELVVVLIVQLAGALVSEGAPGWIALVLLGALGVASTAVLRDSGRQREALDGLRRSLEEAGAGDGPAGLDAADAAMREAMGRGGAFRAVATAWQEYRETHVIDGPDGGAVVRNALRPSVFFNIEDLGFGPGWLRILPNLFVAVGLFLTFLGLIAALTQFQSRMGPAGSLAPEEMGGFLGVASAKFIMSLTGLACSIVFTILLRARFGAVEAALHRLNAAIEDALSFLSEEDLALRMLKEQEQTRSLLQGLATDIATQVAQAMSGMIGGAIRDGLAPVIERVQARSEEGLGALVETLSDRLAGDVGRALSEASARLDLAAERLMQLADRLAETGRATGTALEAAGAATAARLEQAVAALETRAGAGAGAVEAAARALAEAVGGLEAQIGAAGRRAEAAVAAEAEAMLAGARDRLMAPIDSLADRFTAAARAAEAAGAGLREAAAGAERGGAAARAAAEGFGTAARGFVQAAAPVAEAARRIEDSNRSVAQAAAELAQLAANGARAVEAALRGAQAALAAETEGARSVLALLREITERLEGQGEEMDRIDALLGAAFDRYTEEVQAALDQLQGHVRRLQDDLAPAIDTLREVVEQAEAFRPLPTGGRA